MTIPPAFTTRPELTGTFGMVATTHWLASSTGMAMLERGGNAFDAAAAAGFVLQVVEPHMNGPAGDVPMLVHKAGTDKVDVICGQAPAPAGATIEHYRSEGFDLAPGNGLLATVIPGAFDAWMLLLRDYGTMSLRDVMEPAIGYAKDGWPVIPAVADTIAKVESLFRDEWTTSAAVWLANGTPKAGDLMTNPGLVLTWRRMLDEAEAAGGNRDKQIEAARNCWRGGFIAEAIDRFCRENEVMDASGARHKGVLTGQDMAGWEATVEAPLTYDYHGHTFFKCGAWSQGPVMLQQLALLKGFDIAAMDPEAPEFVHTVVECLKLAMADREAFYGDPDFADVPVEALLSDAYNDARRKLVTGEASLEIRPGTVEGYDRPLPEFEVGEGVMPGGGVGLGEPTRAEISSRDVGAGKGDTCHIDVIDRWGNMASVTPSGSWLLSSPAIPELGFCLNSRAQMFWLQEGLPASLAPGKRPRSTLTPSFAFRDGKAWMPFGSPGGDGQDQWPLVFFLRHFHHDMNLQAAIDTPSFFSEHAMNSFWPRRALPGRLNIEGRFSKAALNDLTKRGHDIEVTGDWSLGRVSAVTWDGTFLRAAANPRGMQGYAVGR